MEEGRRRTRWVLWTVVALLALYVGGYFLLGRRVPAGGGTPRVFPTQWLRGAYAPLLKIERRLRT